jgi:hypothetical protein
MSELPADPTKTRWYAATDLLIKAATAAGLIIIGLIGWRLQRDTTLSRDRLEQQDRAERRFLPMLQSLSELQLAAASVATTLRASDGAHDLDSKLRRQGLRITYLADSLVLAEGDRVVHLSPAAEFARLGAHSRSLALPLRCSAVMLGELTQVAPQIRTAKLNSTLAFAKDLHVLTLISGKPVTHKEANHAAGARIYYLLPVDSRSETCWTAWLGPTGMDSSDLYADSIAGLAREVEQGAAGVIHDVLDRHRDIADKYVEVRANILRSGLSD